AGRRDGRRVGRDADCRRRQPRLPESLRQLLDPHQVGPLNPVDLAVDPVSGDVWVSERGTPHFGAGRLSLIARSGTTLAYVTGIEPYGIDVDTLDRSCWVSELRSNRILEIDRSGATVRASPVLDTPYAVRIAVP